MVVDTSALVSIVLGEPDAELLLDSMLGADSVTVSAMTAVESAIVLESRQGEQAAHDLRLLMTRTGTEVSPCDADQATAAVAAWRRFGKGRHPAGLNLGDCFSYALARTSGEPLLFKGRDFAQTDVRSAL